MFEQLAQLLTTEKAQSSPLSNEWPKRETITATEEAGIARELIEQALRVADTVFQTQVAILITDASNTIQHINQAFTRLTGYSAEEVTGQSPSLLQSGRHDPAFYGAMWSALKQKNFWEGEIWDRRKNGEIYPKWLTITAVPDNHGSITHYVGTFTDLSGHKEAEEAIHHLAFYDALTDLPNRRLLRERLQAALNRGAQSFQYGAVLQLDLDNFKDINDSKGHAAGDQLLIEVAQRLRACVRQSDILARMGGDEFTLVLESLGTEESLALEQAREVAEKILRQATPPYPLGDHEYHASLSIGIALFTPQDSLAEEVLMRADAAMYAAKKAGRNTLHFFSPEMQLELKERMALESDLRSALKENQFRIHFQAQVDHNGHVLGAEVLLRWAHPARGLIAPADFIPIAEASGLISPIGEWVLDAACRQLKAWKSSPRTRHLQLSVNVSARQFRHPEFVDQVTTLVRQSGIAPSQLKLELTESLVLHNIADTIAKMRALQQHGIGFSLDDFGTGYSSLTHLKQLPLEQLKIDQSFVRDIVSDPNDAVIVQTIIGMARNLGLGVIAEGVETEAQRAALERYGCTTYQGHLFSRPLPLSEFEERLGPD